MGPKIVTLNDGKQWRRLGKYVPAIHDAQPFFYENINWYDPKHGGWPMNYAVWHWATEVLGPYDRPTQFYILDKRDNQCWVAPAETWRNHMRRGMSGTFGQNITLATMHWRPAVNPKTPWVNGDSEGDFVRLTPLMVPADLGRAPQLAPEDRIRIQDEVNQLLAEKGKMIWSPDAARIEQIDIRLRQLYIEARPGVDPSKIGGPFSRWLDRGTGSFVPKEKPDVG